MTTNWQLREVPGSLVQRYLADGHWRDQTLGVALDAAIRRSGHQPFRIWSDIRPFEGTVGEVGAFAREIAGGLQAAGIGAGDVVTVQAPNWMETVAALWGAAHAGATVIPFIDAYGPAEVQEILASTGSRLHLAPTCFRDRYYVDEVRSAASSLPELSAVWPIESLHEYRGNELHAPVLVDPSTPAVLCFTSGSSTAPKGVIHTHQTFLSEVHQQLAREWPASIGRDLVVSPIGHMAGLVRMVVTPVLRGHPVYGADRWLPDRILQIVREHGLTTASGVPFFIRSLLEHEDFATEDVQYVRHIGTGGAPISEALVRKADQLGISIVRGYGLTEHPTVSNSSHEDPRSLRLFTEGRPLTGVELRLVDEDGREVGPETEGELWTRGPDLCMGYANPNLNVVFDADGWLATGDRAIIDSSGALVIRGRSKDIVIRGGENISASFVEGALMQLPFIIEAAVVASPDERFGERVCAFVRCSDGPVDLEQVRKALAAEHVSRLAWPEELHVVDSFPGSATGKVDKNELRRRIKDELRPVATDRV